jgi:CBS domain-containing protein
MQVRACMTDDAKFAMPETSLKEAARMMDAGSFGAVPVLNTRGEVIGIITDRDICLAIARWERPASEIAVSEVMTRKVFTCEADENIDDAMRTMRHHRVRRLPVIAADGRLAGILSMDDVVLHSDAGAGWISAGIGYGETVGTLKSIYQHPSASESGATHH